MTRENIVQLQKQFTTDKLSVQLQNTSHNSYFICTSVNIYVGIVHSFSTSANEKSTTAKYMAQCKTIYTTAKKSTMAIFLCPLHKLILWANTNLTHDWKKITSDT
jgi:hypothetical protein